MTLQKFVEKALNVPFEMHSLTGDASFRKYSRVKADGKSYIAVDSPPVSENNSAFVNISNKLSGKGVRLPRVLAYDEGLGFLLVEDFGHDHFNALITKDCDDAYFRAIDALVEMQSAWGSCDGLALFDEEFMMRECALFWDWFWLQHLGENNNLKQEYQDFCRQLIAEINRQPKIFVHRDYHSRNLMAVNGDIGILDFQDAVWGPYTYDIVSLLKDCYISWPKSKIEFWLKYYHQKKTAEVVFSDLQNDFDRMGIQRHLKAIGIFARLYHRDGKSRYLSDIPRTWGYIEETCRRLGLSFPLGVSQHLHEMSGN